MVPDMGLQLVMCLSPRTADAVLCQLVETEMVLTETPYFWVHDLEYPRNQAAFKTAEMEPPGDLEYCNDRVE